MLTRYGSGRNGCDTIQGILGLAGYLLTQLTFDKFRVLATRKTNAGLRHFHGHQIITIKFLHFCLSLREFSWISWGSSPSPSHKTEQNNFLFIRHLPEHLPLCSYFTIVLGSYESSFFQQCFTISSRVPWVLSYHADFSNTVH
jgi:hypothetical protein